MGTGRGRQLKRIFLALAIHNHQPVGNFPWVFQDAYERAYLPMIEALHRHPTIQVSLHYSGCLFDWITAKHPEFITMVKGLVRSGQVEMMGGAYYEPILAAIPDGDKRGQLSKMSDFIENVFGKRPLGMWLAERVWEPALASALSEAGLSWTLVDDTGFKMVGKSDDDLYGYYNTEEQGHYLKIFPISKYLRYSIPWHGVDDVIGHLRDHAAESNDRVAVLGDDGEKFGVWPDTYKHCWTNHWVDDFFKAIEDNKEWLSTIKLGDYAAKYPPAGRIYLPCAAYDEMMEWSLPPDGSSEFMEIKRRLENENQAAILKYLHSGYWRNFMVKYPEINRMHKKMLLVHDKVHRAHQINANVCGIDYLWQAQCNCPYWHGVFGGIYLSDIRATTYANLVNAEKCADRVLGTHKSSFDYRVEDYDGDGQQEILVGGPSFNLYLSPHEGGSIIEWDRRSPPFNLLSTMSRKPEAYHKDLARAADTPLANDSEIKSIHDVVRTKEKFDGKFVYDRMPRSSLVDRFIEHRVTLDNFERNEFSECSDFSCRPYECSFDPEGKKLNVILRRIGEVSTGVAHAHIAVEKRIALAYDSENLDIAYKFTNQSGMKIETIFGSEWNINLLGGGHNESAYYRVPGFDLVDKHLDSRGEIHGVQQLFLGNTNLNIEISLQLDRPLTVWRFPIDCISNSEGGVEKVYQASCIVVLLPLSIESGKEAEFRYSWNVEK
jgi:4-alpha-glucanotransferase